MKALDMKGVAIGSKVTWLTRGTTRTGTITSFVVATRGNGKLKAWIASNGTNYCVMVESLTKVTNETFIGLF